MSGYSTKQPVQNIDLIDKKILFELEMAASTPTTLLAKRVGISQERTLYRIERLKKQKIIKKFGIIVSTEYFKFKEIYVIINLQSCDATTRADIERFLCDAPQTKWVSQVLGRIDYFTVIAAKEIIDLTNFVESIQTKYAEYIDLDIIPRQKFLHMKPIHLVDTTTKKPHNIPRQEPSPATVKQKNLHLTPLDFSILQELSIDARQSSAAIARKLNVNQLTIVNHKKELTKHKIILGAYCHINYQKLGLNKYHLLLKLRDITQKSIDLLNQALQKYPTITYANTTMGHWHCSIDITAKDSETAYATIAQLESDTGKLIESYMVLQSLKELKRTSFPEVMAPKQTPE